MKIAVVGTRDYNERDKIFAVLDLVNKKYGITKVITGGARGVDYTAIKWARQNGMRPKVFMPNWELHGRAAGPIRNTEIVQHCDKLIAFWDGKSRGTLDSINKALKENKLMMIVYYKTGEIVTR